MHLNHGTGGFLMYDFSWQWCIYIERVDDLQSGQLECYQNLGNKMMRNLSIEMQNEEKEKYIGNS